MNCKLSLVTVGGNSSTRLHDFLVVFRNSCLMKSVTILYEVCMVYGTAGERAAYSQIYCVPTNSRMFMADL